MIQGVVPWKGEMRRAKPLNDEVGAAVGALVLHHHMVLLHTPTGLSLGQSKDIGRIMKGRDEARQTFKCLQWWGWGCGGCTCAAPSDGVVAHTNWTLSYVPSHISYVQSAATIACNLVCHIFLHAAILNVFLLYTTRAALWSEQQARCQISLIGC